MGNKPRERPYVPKLTWNIAILLVINFLVVYVVMEFVEHREQQINDTNLVKLRVILDTINQGSEQ